MRRSKRCRARRRMYARMYWLLQMRHLRQMRPRLLATRVFSGVLGWPQENLVRDRGRRDFMVDEDEK